MKFIGMFLIAILGFIIGETISRMIRNDPSTSGDNSGLTWFIKLVVAGILVSIVYESCD